MSPDLIAFLKAWHEWATNGAREGEPFSREDGLCNNIAAYAEQGKLSASDMGIELVRLFPTGLNARLYPFGTYDFHSRRTLRTQHECPKRLAWVRERLIEAGELVT